MNICEDIWYPDGPTRDQALAGAEVIININASPYHRGKGAYRETMISTRASDNAVVVCYVNAVGGQDELVFDGHSLICDERGELVARGRAVPRRPRRVRHRRRRRDAGATARSAVPQGARELRAGGERRRSPCRRRRSPATKPAISPPMPPLLDPMAEVWEALVLGVRDYIGKTGFETVLIGLSGGIDSSIVAAIAVDALGPEHVVGVSMPSRFSSDGSKTRRAGAGRAARASGC